ncbi:MAG TPA: hypothetical protein VMV56_02830 [Williamwhitmania sp.]|nr:hypothetical protein [Williamwhitmania sp.]
MKGPNLFALNEHSIRRTGLIFAGIFIVLEIIAKVTGSIQHMHVSLVNIYTMLALFMAAFSKDKVDDERSQAIRYFSLKVTFKCLLAAISINYIYKFNFESIYIANSSLIVYLIIYHLANYYNPVFIFKEGTRKKNWSDKLLVIIMLLIGTSFFIHIVQAMLTS